MSFELGIFTDLSDENSIADPMVMVRAAAIQLPFAKGRVWEDARIKPDPESNRKFDIYSRTETPRGGTIGTGGVDDTVVVFPITATAGLIKGLVLNVAGEYVVIKSVDSATQITVRERGTAGTTAAAHIATTAFTVVGSAIDDVDLKDIDSVSEITNIYQNYMQTTAEPIDYTRGGQLDPRKGLNQAQLDLLEEEALLRVAKGISQTTIFGLKAEKDGDAPWMTAGILQQLSDASNGRLVLTYDAAGALTEAKLKAALREVTERGTPTDIYVSAANKDIINEFLGASAATKLSVNTDMSNTTAGYYVDSYNYEGLILNVKIDADMPDSQIAIMNMNKVWKGWKRGDELRLEKQPDASSREHRSAYNGSYFIAIEDVGYEHILITGVTA